MTDYTPMPASEPSGQIAIIRQPMTAEHSEDIQLRGNRTIQEAQKINNGKRKSNLEPVR